MPRDNNQLRDLEKQVSKDINSEDGKEAVEIAIASSSQTNRELNERTWLDPKKLDEPITD